MTRMTGALDRALDEAAALLDGARRLLIGTGAGMSVDSGFAAFRRAGSRGWQAPEPFASRGISPEDLSCPAAFEEDPAGAWGCWEWKRRAAAACQPHSGYAALAGIAAGRESFLQTTNIDGLHRRAGWPAARLHEVHGSLWRLQCCEVWEEVRVPCCDLDEASLRAGGWPRCPSCGEAPRPHILMFADLGYWGDPAAEQARRRFQDDGVDALLIVGESGVISTHEHDGRVLRARQGELRVIDIHPDPGNKAAALADVQLPCGAAEGLTGLAARL